jgi:enoyl-CoA hydratase/carnithine racemase
MDEDILIRVEGRAGRITLNRPAALNALTWEMCGRIETALDAWAEDDSVAMLVIDAAERRRSVQAATSRKCMPRERRAISTMDGGSGRTSTG